MEFNDKAILNSEIEKQKAFYEVFFDNIPLDIGIFDNELRYKFLNKSAVKDEKVRKWLINKTMKDYFDFRNLDLQLADERQALLHTAISEKNIVIALEILVFEIFKCNKTGAIYLASNYFRY